MHKVAEAGDLKNNGRLHVRVDGRYVTIFKHNGIVSAIDSICHHAGGPLTLGEVKDIEELGVTVVLCPWHKFMVTINEGLKVYQAIDIVNGKPVNTGWKIGKTVQRFHNVDVREDGIYVSLRIDDSFDCTSDKDSCNTLCARPFTIHADVGTSLP